MNRTPSFLVGEAELQAYVDGRLECQRRRAVEGWLASHPGDASRVAAYRVLGEQWRAAYAPVLEEPVPSSLVSALPATARPVARFVRVAALVVIGVVVALAAWTLAEPHVVPGSAAAEMVRRAVIAHTVYAAEVQHPVEAHASGKAYLLAWLSERLNMKVEAPDLGAAGLSLMGGRLLPGDRAAAALLMYEGATGQRVTLYWGPEFRQQHDTGLRYVRGERGTRVYYWLDDECGYAIASADLGQKELLRVALLAYAQFEK
jgi:anti-sigma factor RsiW